jgi:hypothetical protein
VRYCLSRGLWIIHFRVIQEILIQGILLIRGIHLESAVWEGCLLDGVGGWGDV